MGAVIHVVDVHRKGGPGIVQNGPHLSVGPLALLTWLMH